MIPNIKNNKIFIATLVTIIFLVGTFLRFYHLNIAIPSLYVDEIIGGYNTFHLFDPPALISLGTFGKIFLASLNFSWIFGLTTLGERTASAFYGSFIPVGIFFFSLISTKKLASEKRLSVALLGSLLSAILPWSFMISRIGHTAIPVVILLVCLHLVTLLKGTKSLQILLSLIPLCIGVLYYPSMVIMVPIVSLPVIYFATLGLDRAKRKLLWSALVGVVLIFGIIGAVRFQIFNPQGRGLDLAIWKDVNVTADSNYYRGLARLSTPTIFSFNKNPESIANKILYNYPVSVIQVFTKNYLSFFSQDFLFLKGDNVLRHSTGMVGEFYPFLIPFMVYGAFVFFSKADKKLKTIFLVWILVSPVPAAITKDGATYLLRVITMMPFLTYFCTQGIVSSFDFFKKTWLKIIYGATVSMIGIFSVYSFLYGYFHVYPALSAQSWEYGFKEVADFQFANRGKLLTIWDDKYPVWYFCFWQKLPSTICDLNIMNKSEMINNSRIDLPTNDLLFSLPQTDRDLLLILSKYQPKYIAIPEKEIKKYPESVIKLKPIQIINYPDGTPDFNIFELIK